MQISIDTPSLIDRAKRVSGLSYGEMAEQLGKSRARISEWISGKAEPSTDEIAYLAEKAGLPIIKTVAALKPAFAPLWLRAEAEIEKPRKPHSIRGRSGGNEGIRTLDEALHPILP